MHTRQSIRTVLSIIIGLAIVGGLGTYIYYQSRAFVTGPVIQLKEPADGATFEEPLITVGGTAKHISYISLNGRQIYTNEKGEFKEKLLLLPGYNIITIDAEDKFDRSTEKTIEVVLHDEDVTPPIPSDTATTTPTTTVSNRM